MSKKTAETILNKSTPNLLMLRAEINDVSSASLPGQSLPQARASEASYSQMQNELTLVQNAPADHELPTVPKKVEGQVNKLINSLKAMKAANAALMGAGA